VALDGTLTFTHLPGSFPPLYAQTLADFDGDSTAAETVIVRRQQANATFFAEIVGGVPSQPLPMQQIPLPSAFVPGCFAVVDVNLDGALDVCIQDFEGGPSARLLNDGAGQFQLVFELYPGSNADFDFTVSSGGPACGSCNSDIHFLAPGNSISTLMASPGGSWLYSPILMIGQFFAPGTPPASPPGFNEVHLDPFGVPLPFILIDGTFPTPLGPAVVLQPGGNAHFFLTPPGLSGLSCMLQAFVLTPSAPNSYFVASTAHELRFN
jgi:hypothetical protein